MSSSPWKDGRFHVNTRDLGGEVRVVLRVPQHAGGHVEHVLTPSEAAAIAIQLCTCAETIRNLEGQ